MDPRGTSFDVPLFFGKVPDRRAAEAHAGRPNRGYNHLNHRPSGCSMKPRHFAALLLSSLVVLVNLVNADEQKSAPPPHISKQTRMDLFRAFNAELVYIRSPFPMGKKGLMLRDDKLSSAGDELEQMSGMWGPGGTTGDHA